MQQISFASVDPENLPTARHDRTVFDDRPKVVGQWLAGLPVADPEITSQRVLEALEKAGSVRMKAGARLAYLLQLETMAAYLTDSLRKRYHLQPLPLSTRSAQAATRLQDVAAAMVRGYRMVLLSDPGGVFGLSRRARAQAYVAICRHTGAVLLEHWHLYRRPSAGIWHTLHACWREASVQGIHRRRVPVGAGRESVEHLYKQFVLTAAADPWRMPRGHVSQVHRLLAPAADLARLVTPDAEAMARATFTIDLDADREPQPLHRDGGDNAVVSVGVLTDAVSRALRSRLENPARHSNDSDAPVASEETLINSLISAFESSPRRGADRHPTQDLVSLTVGLARIRRVLVSLTAPTEDEEPLPPASATPLPWEADTDSDDDLWSLLPDIGTGAEHLVAAPVGGAVVRRHRRSLDVEQEEGWQVVNSSPGGYCLFMAQVSRTRIRIGELVLLSREDDDVGSDDELGVIRWIQREGVSGIRAGVEIIGCGALPADVRRLGADGPVGDRHEGLMLQTRRTDDPRPDSLLLHAATLGGDCQVEVVAAGRSRTVSVSADASDSGLFERLPLLPASGDAGRAF